MAKEKLFIIAPVGAFLKIMEFTLSRAEGFDNLKKTAATCGPSSLINVDRRFSYVCGTTLYQV
ncbi:hypothetical protein [Paenibacillus sp. QZ-Y1]|uniref:hypothetical protein n=1 Tax=Paenibacillus sp. QZ-Y1 TaxID=3414511 RepID=UPI003F7B2372